MVQMHEENAVIFDTQVFKISDLVPITDFKLLQTLIRCYKCGRFSNALR